jgi:Na+/H+ antiporter NhaB
MNDDAIPDAESLESARTARWLKNHAEWFIALGTACVVVALASTVGEAGLVGLLVLVAVIALAVVTDHAV